MGRQICSATITRLSRKKHNAVNFHIIRESVAAKMIQVGKEDTVTNIADVFTKLVPFTWKRELLARFLWDQ